MRHANGHRRLADIRLHRYARMYIARASGAFSKSSTCSSFSSLERHVDANLGAISVLTHNLNHR